MRGLYATKLQTWDRLCIMSDPDKAGDKIAEEIDVSLARHGKRIDRLRLPSGFDCAKLREERPGELGRIVRAWLRGS